MNSFHKDTQLITNNTWSRYKLNCTTTTAQNVHIKILLSFQNGNGFGGHYGVYSALSH